MHLVAVLPLLTLQFHCPQFVNFTDTWRQPLPLLTIQFDCPQFVNFTDTWRQYKHDPRKLEAMFALRALMEIPEQFKVIVFLNAVQKVVSSNCMLYCLSKPRLDGCLLLLL